jgi:diguanylate cyclase (GGDEF)-like protein/excisionase family DNA binding protein
MGSTSTPTTERRWLRLGPAAELLGVSVNTLRRWSDAGRIACYRSAGGHRRFRRSDIEALLRENGGRREAAATAGDEVEASAVAALQARNHDLELIVEAGEDVARLSTRDVLERVARRLARLTHTPVADIYAVEGERIRALVSYDHGSFDGSWEGATLAWRDFPCTALAVETRAIALAADLDDPVLTPGGRASLEKWGYQSQLSAPLVARDAVIGVLELSDYVPRDFHEHLDLIEGLAQVAGRALDTAVLFDEVRQRNVILHELVEFGALVARAEDPTELLRTAAQRLVEVLDVADCDVFTLEGDSLLSRVSYDRNGFDDEAVGHSLRLDSFHGAKEAIESQQMRIIASPDDPALDPDERDVFMTWGFRSNLSLPLVVDGVVYGLLDIYDDEPNDYGQYLDFLQTVGQLLAAALGKTRLLDAVELSNRELRELVDSGLELGASLELDEVLRSAASRMRELTDADECEIAGLEGDELVVHICTGREHSCEERRGERRPLAADSVADRAVQRREPVAVRDVTVDPDLGPAERARAVAAGRRASIHLPLVARGDVVGLVALYDHAPREFAQVRLLHGLAQIVAQAMVNAILYRQLDESSRRLALVSDASLQLSATLELPDILHSTAERLCEVTGVPACDIHLVAGDELVCAASVKRGQPVAAWIGSTHTLADWPAVTLAVARRETVQLASLDDPRRGPIEIAELRAYGYQAELVVPLVAKDGVIGVVDLLDPRSRDFSTGTVATAEAICRASALAIDNANLFEAVQLRRRETELLNAIARRTGSSLELAEIAAATVDELRQLIAFERADLALAGDDHDLDLIYSSEPAERRGTRQASPQERDALAAIRRERVAFHAPGAMPLLPSADGEHAGASIALLHDDRLIGVLLLSGPDERVFAGVDRHLLERVGTHLSLAINNARLYDEIKLLHLGNLKALTSALNAKDYYTLGHAARVGAYTVLLGHELGWTDETTRQVEEAAYLHDIGKIGVPDRVLLKPSGLNPHEWALMRQHPIFSADILRPLFADDLVLGVRHHHEHWDGSGYPDGLAGEAIPLVARAMCVADSYDAMSFRRPYRQALRYHEALAELDRCSGSQFDPAMVDAFKRVLERMQEQRSQAREIAALAAATVDPAAHATLAASHDEGASDYARLTAALRDVRDEHPGVRFITTVSRDDEGKCAIILDAEEDPAEHSTAGSAIFADDELLETLAGDSPDVNVLYIDQWGVWVCGLARVRDDQGGIVALVEVDVAPAGVSGLELRGLRSDVAQAFASMFGAAAARPDRTELDAITDGLTGLYNHRYLHERLAEEVARAGDLGQSASLLFCGLDRFTEFNERHGHHMGDDALRAVARVIDGCIRHVDLAARFGGEEFAVILIDTDAEAAVEVADRLRREVAAAPLLPGQDAPLTMSIGLATYPADANRKDELIDKARWAMHVAKRAGRDRVARFSPGESAEAGEGAAGVGET